MRDRRDYMRKQVLSYYRRVKKLAVEYKGGHCYRCGYDRCIGALGFHHTDPAAKEFKISGSTRSFDKIKPELDKCLLVCANCHAEIHAGQV